MENKTTWPFTKQRKMKKYRVFFPADGGFGGIGEMHDDVWAYSKREALEQIKRSALYADSPFAPEHFGIYRIKNTM